MTEKQVFFPSGHLHIEGLINPCSGTRGVAISHPHPLYGGNMYNSVVESIARVYHEAGFTTLRFNFRGVGGSAGEHDEGQGERQDVRSALQHLTAEGKTVLELAGYSFGAWVNARTDLTSAGVQRTIMVSPPVAFLDFSLVAVSPRLKLVIAGSRDQIAPPELIRTMLPQWNPEARLKVIEGADHFYIGFAEKLELILADYLDSGLASKG